MFIWCILMPIFGANLLKIIIFFTLNYLVNDNALGDNAAPILKMT